MKPWAIRHLFQNVRGYAGEIATTFGKIPMGPAGEVTERDTTQQGMRGGHVRQGAVTAALLIPTIAVAAYVTLGEVRARKEAEEQRQRAEQAFTTATVASNNLISDLARRLRAITGVPPEISRELLDRARALDDQLLIAGHPAPEVLQGTIAALDEIALTLSAIGDIRGASGVADHARQVTEGLLARNPEDSNLQRETSIAYEKLGNLQFTHGNYPESLKSQQASLAIRKRLAAGDSSNVVWQRDLAVAHEKMGDVQLAQGNFAEAVDSYQANLAIRSRLVEAHPDDARLARDYAVSHYKIGDLNMAQSNWSEALKSYQAGFPISERLAKVDPDNKLLHRDLAALHDRIGDAQKALGDLAEAMKSFQASFAIRDRISKFEPGDLGWQRDLAVSYGKIAEVYRQAERIPDALEALKRGREIVTRLTRLSPDDARLKRHLAQLDGQLAELTRGASAPP
jgi:tetratricopeptide (TPR) repeat protein